MVDPSQACNRTTTSEEGSGEGERGGVYQIGVRRAALNQWLPGPSHSPASGGGNGNDQGLRLTT